MRGRRQNKVLGVVWTSGVPLIFGVFLGFLSFYNRNGLILGGKTVDTSMNKSIRKQIPRNF